jgi:Flp pilus assembly pilin Flp
MQTTILAGTDDRGTVMVEYAVLLSVVAVGCSLAVIALGAPLVRMFIAQELWLMLAVP